MIGDLRRHIISALYRGPSEMHMNHCCRQGGSFVWFQVKWRHVIFICIQTSIKGGPRTVFTNSGINIINAVIVSFILWSFFYLRHFRPSSVAAMIVESLSSSPRLERRWIAAISLLLSLFNLIPTVGFSRFILCLLLFVNNSIICTTSCSCSSFSFVGYLPFSWLARTLLVQLSPLVFLGSSLLSLGFSPKDILEFSV